jgi:hypothetical protein
MAKILVAEAKGETLNEINDFRRIFTNTIKIKIKKQNLLTFLCSGDKTSHIEATILDTSPNEAFGFCPLMAAWVSRKKRAYAETGLQNKREKNAN